MIIDGNLKWINDISYVYNKILNFLLYHLNNLDLKHVKQLYNSFVFPLLIYDIAICGNDSIYI